MFSEKKKAAQPEFWVVAQQVPKSPKATFYSKLDETLEGFGFAEKCAGFVRRLISRPMWGGRESIQWSI
jgi:hypothetical protein